jgi:hypothetical protein
MVRSSNQDFDGSMDETFTLAGGWSRSGSNYVRDIIVHSTLFNSAITDRVVVGAYKWYVMDYWELNTRLDDDYLEGLDYLGIQGLIGLVQSEIQIKSEEVFGSDGNGGLFTTWVGKAPIMANGGVAVDGSGELGRLLKEYYTWSMKQAQGIALMDAPLWEKPFWDSRDSFFQAPSLRTVVDIGIAVVATVASVYTGGSSLALLALTLADDAVFTVLDVAGGYKSWDEAGFAFGKKALISAATTSIGSAFQGVQAAITTSTTGIQGVIGQTMLSGVKALSTSTVTSALNAVTYSSGSGFGWSKEAYKAGMLGGLTSAAVGMASTFTGGSLGLINSGANMEKLTGFSRLNMQDVGVLNNTLGAVAGQGVNYALTGDFALNLLKVVDPNNSSYSTGLLELHLGDQGFKMNLGTDGADMSFGTIAGALRGSAVWGTNTLINYYTKENNLNIPVSLRAQYGFGDKDQKKQLWGILGGIIDVEVKDGKYSAKSDIDAQTGKKVIYLGDYKENMTVSEQMRLGAILGHEAYRDGMGSEDFDELKTASIARIQIGDRINDDYSWFYGDYNDLGFESYLLSQTGGDEAFDDYLKKFYKNDEDYYWKWIETDGEHQNDDKYRGSPLLNDYSKKEIQEKNASALEDSLKRYKEILENKDSYEGNASLFVEGKTDAEIEEYIKTNKELKKELKYYERGFFDLYNYGCVLFSTMYAAETLTNQNLDPAWVNEYVAKNGLSINRSELSKEIMAEVMTLLTGGEFKIKLHASRDDKKLFTPSELLIMEDSKDMYFSHVRVKTGGLIHSEMVSGIGYDVSDGYRVGVKFIDTVNSWTGSGSTKLTATQITPDMISRWDVFKATPTYLYYYNQYKQLGR